MTLDIVIAGLIGYFIGIIIAWFMFKPIAAFNKGFDEGFDKAIEVAEWILNGEEDEDGNDLHN